MDRVGGGILESEVGRSHLEGCLAFDTIGRWKGAGRYRCDAWRDRNDEKKRGRDSMCETSREKEGVEVEESYPSEPEMPPYPRKLPGCLPCSLYINVFLHI